MIVEQSRPSLAGGSWRKQHLARRSAAGPVDRALWYIESNLASVITLEDVVGFAGVSRLHLLRAFNAVTGYPLMRYVRARRLGEAEAFKMGGQVASVDPPRFADSERLLIAGLAERYDARDRLATAGQWQRFASYLGNIAGQVGRIAYGTSYYTDEDGNMEYLSGVQVSDFSSVPRNFGLLCVSARHCAVFFHRGHVSTIRATWIAIWNQWLPGSGHEVADAPFFERYGESFDPRTGNGGAEIWVPIVAGAGARLIAAPAR